MVSSWKKITFSKKYKYLNSIFNWIDSVDSSLRYNKIYGKKRYLLIKFEDIHRNPKKIVKKVCKFLKIKYDQNMIKGNKWKKLLKNRFNYINESAYDKDKKVFGFSTQRINNWKNHLSNWEIELINYLCKSRLKKFGYSFSKPSYKKAYKGISILRSDPFLKKGLNYFKKRNLGSNISFMNDPTNSKNWESRIIPGKKFRDTKEYSGYIAEIKKIHKISQKIKKIKK